MIEERVVADEHEGCLPLDCCLQGKSHFEDIRRLETRISDEVIADPQFTTLGSP